MSLLDLEFTPNLPSSLNSPCIIKFTPISHFKTEDDPSMNIKRRLTTLEVDNAEVQNSTEVLRFQLAQAETKIFHLEKEVTVIKTENCGLKGLLLEMKEEFRAFQREMSAEIYELKNEANLNKEGQIAFDIHRLAKRCSVKDNSLDTTYNKSEKSFATHRNSEDNNTGRVLDLTKSIFTDSPIFSNSPFADRDFTPMSRSRFSESSPMRNRVMEVKPFGQIQTSFNLGSPSQGAIVEEEGAQSSESPHFFTPNLSKDKSCFMNSSHSNASPSLSNGTPGEERKICGDRKLWESPQSAPKIEPEMSEPFKPERLFENLLIFELGKDDSGSKGRVLYNYMQSLGLEEEVVCTEEMKEIIMGNKITMMEDKQQEEYICSFVPHKQELLLAKWHEDVEAFNSQNRLYAICVKTDVIYYVLTYYPVTSVCFDSIRAVIGHIDAQKINGNIEELLWNPRANDFIREVLEVPAPQPGKPIEISSLKYNCREEGENYLEVASWKSSKVFSRFSLDNINLLLSALLLDKPLVLISENTTLLTASLNTLLGLLAPFKYQYDIISTLVSSNTHLLESSRPLILCVNKKEEVFKEKEILSCKDKICVFLDSKVIYLGRNNEFPVLEVCGEVQRNAYKELNNGSRFDIVSEIKNLRSQKSGLIVPQKVKQNHKRSEEEILKRRKCVEEVFRSYKEYLQKNLMEYIVMIYEASVEGKGEEWNRGDQNVEEFLTQYKQTQGFWSVLDELSNK